jgi:hypothetical protein
MQELVDRAKKWFLRKVALAERLANGECEGSYGDSVLVLSAVISRIAAELWPSEGIDRKRFVEVWARYSDPNLLANQISLPLLVAMLRGQKLIDLAEKARLIRGDCISEIPALDTLVVTGDRVDVSESDVLAVIPELSLGTLRSQSYGNIFYRNFRSAYVHEYKAGTYGDEYVMSHTRGNITYTNTYGLAHRRINFDADWLVAVARSICERAIEDFWKGERPQPPRWWLEG